MTWQGHLTSMRSVQYRLPLSHNATDWWTAHIFKTTWTWIMGRKGEFALFFTITIITSFVFRFLWVNRSIDMQFILSNIVCLFYWLIELKIITPQGFEWFFHPHHKSFSWTVQGNTRWELFQLFFKQSIASVCDGSSVNQRQPRRSVCQFHMDKMGWVVETPMN